LVEINLFISYTFNSFVAINIVEKMIYYRRNDIIVNFSIYIFYYSGYCSNDKSIFFLKKVSYIFFLYIWYIYQFILGLFIIIFFLFLFFCNIFFCFSSFFLYTYFWKKNYFYFLHLEYLSLYIWPIYTILFIFHNFILL